MIGSFIKAMLPAFIIALIIVVVTRSIMNLVRKRKIKDINWLHEVGILLFVMLLAGIASQTVVPSFYISNGKLTFWNSYNENTRLAINLVPFQIISEISKAVSRGVWDYSLYQALGNVAMFVPIGFLLPLLWRKFETFYVLALGCLSISLFIELVQLAIPVRATDIDDLILNTLGGVVGGLLYLIVKRLSKSKTDNFKLKKKNPELVSPGQEIK